MDPLLGKYAVRNAKGFLLDPLSGGLRVNSAKQSTPQSPTYSRKKKTVKKSPSPQPRQKRNSVKYSNQRVIVQRKTKTPSPMRLPKTPSPKTETVRRTKRTKRTPLINKIKRKVMKVIPQRRKKYTRLYNYSPELLPYLYRSPSFKGKRTSTRALNYRL